MDYVIAAVSSSLERHYDERIRLERLRDHSNPFEIEDIKFKKLFRIPKSGAIYLVNNLDCPILNEGYIPKFIKILSALQFFAQGSYQAAVGQDNFIGLSQPSVSRCIDVVTIEIIKKLTPHFIKFPTTSAEKDSAKAAFQQLFNMPNVLGAVDGTHVAIAKPTNNHPTAPGNLFYNRKGFYSINCQIVCCARGKIIAFNPNFPGSTHDAAIWRASKVYHFLKTEFLQGEREQWLLGDKGYPLQPWLMTPVMDPSTAAEELYNERHAKARNVVEMCNGRIKNKFRCLHRHRCLHYEPEKAAKIILSCCTLYNMFFDALTDENECDEEENQSNTHTDEENSTDFLAEARQIRQTLINRIFNGYI